MDSFHFIWPEDVDRVLCSLRLSSYPLDPCPACLIWSAWTDLTIGRKDGWTHLCRREWWLAFWTLQLYTPPWKKNISRFHQSKQLSSGLQHFLSKVIEWVVVFQLQGILDEMNDLDPLQSGFRQGFGTEMTLVALLNDHHQELDKGYMSLLVLLDFSIAFDTINPMVSFWVRWPIWGLEALFCGGSAPSWWTDLRWWCWGIPAHTLAFTVWGVLHTL